jgi:DNA polymerase-3 subunit alpha
VSLPDIDIDLMMKDGSSVMDYAKVRILSKQIITYGRWQRNQLFVTQHVCWIPLFEADKIAKLIPGMMPSKWNLALPE